MIDTNNSDIVVLLYAVFVKEIQKILCGAAWNFSSG